MQVCDLRWMRDERWYHFNDNGRPIIHNDAPQYVKES